MRYHPRDAYPVTLTDAAIGVCEETGTYPDAVRADVDAVRAGMSAAELLARCLDGADDDRADAWRDYVDAVVAHVDADRVTVADVRAAVDAVVRAERRDRAASIDAAACGDYADAHRAEEAAYEARDKLDAVLARVDRALRART
jgi:hypothetical protein